MCKIASLDTNSPLSLIVGCVGTGYKLAALATCSASTAALNVLSTAMRSERESVRRAAMYGFAAVGGGRATELLLDASTSDVKWVRKAATFALGECGATTPAVLRALTDRLSLANESSVYVRSVAAAACACLVRRAAAATAAAYATGAAARSFVQLMADGLRALIQALQSEVNRIPMDQAQKRGIKFVRPTDECDVCEGHSGPLFDGAFQSLRSAVRENVLWACVIMCSHTELCLRSYQQQQEQKQQKEQQDKQEREGVQALSATLAVLEHVAQTEKNVISVGLATDALHRLASGAAAYALVAAKAPDSSGSSSASPAAARLAANASRSCETVATAAPILCWETLCRSSAGMEALRKA